VPEQPPTGVVTGAAGGDRQRARQLAAAILGWALWAGLIGWLALHASPDALHVATFLTTVVVTVALLTVLTALTLRPAVMRRRARPPKIGVAPDEPPAPGAGLEGEIAVKEDAGGRTYVSAQEART
jgi:hypothetical protein